MDTNKPMALRLADKYEHEGFLSDHKFAQNQWCSHAAVELRRLHAENESLSNKLQTFEALGCAVDDLQLLRMGYASARLEIASLKVRAADARHDIDDLTARDESQRLRIAELEAQLEAIGAGGVEPLRKRECLRQIIEPAPSEWDVRGHLAESLTCWPRLTGQEAAELVELFQGRESQALANAPIDADAQRDAERYRWLRKQHWNEGVLCVVAQPKKSVKLGCDCPSLDRLDCFIDAASAAQGGAA